MPALSQIVEILGKIRRLQRRAGRFDPARTVTPAQATDLIYQLQPEEIGPIWERLEARGMLLSGRRAYLGEVREARAAIREVAIERGELFALPPARVRVL